MKYFVYLGLLSSLFLNQCTTAENHNDKSKKINYKVEKSNKALGIADSTIARNAKYKSLPLNIALFGIDQRKDGDIQNSDVIIILSITPETKQIKMISIMRDTYLSIDGHGMNKINAAYAFGGPQLAIKTLNQNFALDIKEHITIDFNAAAEIADKLGGVEINIKQDEIEHLNFYLKELAVIENKKPVLVTKPGLQALSGKQAVAYTRIRYAGNGDYERTERQRNVMVNLFNKLRNAGLNFFPIFFSNILPNLEISMDNKSMYVLGSNLLSRDVKILQARYPKDEVSKGKIINKIWYLTTDLNATRKDLISFIYQ
jgi:LCP family protein required for cell wall assembly